MTRYIKTPLDTEYKEALKEIRDRLLEINQKAVKTKQPDIKYSSCSLIETIDTMLDNIEGRE